MVLSCHCLKINMLLWKKIVYGVVNMSVCEKLNLSTDFVENHSTKQVIMELPLYMYHNLTADKNIIQSIKI